MTSWARLTLFLLLLAPAARLHGQEERGNRAYRRGDYATAVLRYRDAWDEEGRTPRLNYNLGTALLQLGESEEARERLAEGLAAQTPELRARAFYNLGNALVGRTAESQPRQEELRGAIEAYKRALLLDPENQDARWNLELALRRLEELTEQESSQPDAEPEPQVPPQDQGEGDAQEPQGGPGPPNQPQAGQRPPPESVAPDGTDSPLPPDLAEQILRAVEERERDLQREKLKRQRKRVKGPDW